MNITLIIPKNAVNKRRKGKKEEEGNEEEEKWGQKRAEINDRGKRREGEKGRRREGGDMIGK